MLESRRGFLPNPWAYVSGHKCAGCVWLVQNHSSSWAFLISAFIPCSALNILRFPQITWLTLPKHTTPPHVTICIEYASLCLRWLRQISIKDVISLNLALILHPTCLTLGSTPSIHQRYLISGVSVVWDSASSIHLWNSCQCFRQSWCLSLSTEIFD